MVSCDASPYGVGTVLSHIMEDGSKRPVAHASRTLSTAERNYGHLDKELLAVVFALKKSHQFLYSRHFKIYTNHKTLLGLLHPEKATPLMVSRSMQRCTLPLQLMSVNCCIAQEVRMVMRMDSVFLPVLDVQGSTPVTGDILHHLETINTGPEDAAKMEWGAAREAVLSQTLQFFPQGWPSEIYEEALKKYFIRREELSVHVGCLLWGARIIVAPQERNEGESSNQG